MKILTTSTGFTILELIITISLVTITLGILTFHQHQSPLTTLASQAQTLLTQINYYSLISRTSKCDLFFEFKTNSYTISPSQKTSCSLKQASYKILSPVQITNVNFASNSKNKSSLLLRHTGINSPGTITLNDSQNNHCQIIISLRGANRFICN